MDLEAIHQALAKACNLIVGSNGASLRAFPSLPGAITPPTFAPVEFALDYNQTFQGGTTAAGMVAVVITCGVFTSIGDTDRGRAALLGYLAPNGSSSIKAALEADRSLGGVTKTLLVARVHGAYRIYDIGADQYLGAMVDVKVWA